jgi:hypothetical protein
MILSLLTLCWTTNSFGSSVITTTPIAFRPDRGRSAWQRARYSSSGVLGGFPPRSVIDKQYGAHRWTEFSRGGHFMATEQPALLSADRAEFRRSLKGAR